MSLILIGTSYEESIEVKGLLSDSIKVSPAVLRFGVGRSAKPISDFVTISSGLTDLEIIKLNTDEPILLNEITEHSDPYRLELNFKLAREDLLIGRHEGWLELETNDPAFPFLRIRTVIDVAGTLIADSAFVTIDASSNSSWSLKTLKLHRSDHSPFRIASVHSESDFIALEWTKGLFAEHALSIAPKEGADVSFQGAVLITILGSKIHESIEVPIIFK